MLRTLQTHAQIYANERAALNQALSASNQDSLGPYVWEFWDEELVTLQKERLAIFDDLSMSVSVDVPLNKTDYIWWKNDGDFGVQHDMDFDPMVDVHQLETERVSVPIPIIRSRFGWGYRESMSVEQSFNGQLAAEHRVESAYAVMDAMEDMCLYGPKVRGVRVGQGLLNYTHRHALTYPKGDGDLNGTTGEKWKNAVLVGLKALQDDHFGGMPTTMYVNDGDWLYANSTPYSDAYGGGSIATFVQGMGVNVVVVPRLAPNTLLFVIKQRGVVAMPYAMPMAIRPERRLDIRDPYRFVNEAVVSIAPKSDMNNKCGIAVVTRAATGGGG